jgi:hypothetical protein
MNIMLHVETSIKDMPKTLKKPHKPYNAGVDAVNFLKKYRGVGYIAGHYKDADDIVKQCRIFRGSDE